MRKSTPATEEVIGTKLIENTIQLGRIPLSEGYVVCETCGAKCREGSQVTAVAVRPNELSMWQTESTYCDRHAPSIEQHTTQARRTAVVSGRVGRVMDHAYQHEWRILLGAVLEAVSPSGTREVTDTQTPPLQNLLRVPEKSEVRTGGRLSSRRGMMPDGDESDAAVTNKRSQTDATPTPTEVPPMVAVYHHEAHRFRLRGPADTEDTFAGVRVNEPVPQGADVDAALLSRPCYDDTQDLTTHFTPFRHSLLSGDKVAPEREATELREWLRGAVQITDPKRLHKRWLTATEPAWLAESAYHRFTSLKYHVLLTGALLDNYRAGHSFNELYLTVDHGDPARGDIEPYRTICTTPVATLTLTGDPGTTPAVPLGPAPAQSFADIWARLPTYPMDTETVSGWGLVDKRLRDIRAWSTGLQLLEDGTTVDWQPDATGGTK